jgi:hypothetical protein
MIGASMPPSGDATLDAALRLLAAASDPEATAKRIVEMRAAEQKALDAAANLAARERAVAEAEADLQRRVDETRGEFSSLAAARAAADKARSEADALVAKIKETLAND